MASSRRRTKAKTRPKKNKAGIPMLAPGADLRGGVRLPWVES